MGKGLFTAAASTLLMVSAACAQTVTFAPYLQPGDNGPFGPTDQIVIAWQTDESTPHASNYQVEYGPNATLTSMVTPSGRIVDNYLAADPSLPALPNPYGAHTNYHAVLTGLAYDTTYTYKVTGPGLPAEGFSATFHTRKRGNKFSFAVEGDEGSFPAIPNSNPAQLADFEARIVHLIYNTGKLNVPGMPSVPSADFVVNTGDNVYTYGDEANYRDFFFPVFNADQDSPQTGAPLIRNLIDYIVDGNHDLGSTGVSVNMLASDSAPHFSGNMQGGDAMSYFNDLYYPLNGPSGVDIQYTWNKDSTIPNGMTFSYQGKTYNSPAAIDAFRASTLVDTGSGVKRQVDHMSNYSFDYGNAHFVYLDANPHLFDGVLSSASPVTTSSPTFPAYPDPLRDWLIHDLDSSKATWKIVVYHQPAFTSGDATLLNSQMRAIGKFLEDHGVSVVFNGHDHNYQRTLPLRATDRTALPPTASQSSPAVYIDPKFDGQTDTVPDGVIYVVEGAGGNRDFDNNLPAPRGSGNGVDQEDSASGTYTPTPGLTVDQGPADWLDTNLTNLEMQNVIPNAGKGPKITARFKAKLFSFGQVVVDNNKFTLYQISEPLSDKSSATDANPAPFGTDANGKPVNDPIGDTVLSASNGQVTSGVADGPSALLDWWSVTKPELSSVVTVNLFAAPAAIANRPIVYTLQIRNNSSFALNGTQIHLTLPSSATAATTESDTLTIDGSDVVSTIGRLEPGATKAIQIKARVNGGISSGSILTANAQLTSGTAMPLVSNTVQTRIVNAPAFPGLY